MSDPGGNSLAAALARLSEAVETNTVVLARLLALADPGNHHPGNPSRRRVTDVGLPRPDADDDA